MFDGTLHHKSKSSITCMLRCSQGKIVHFITSTSRHAPSVVNNYICFSFHLFPFKGPKHVRTYVDMRLVLIVSPLSIYLYNAKRVFITPQEAMKPVLNETLWTTSRGLRSGQSNQLSFPQQIVEEPEHV